VDKAKTKEKTREAYNKVGSDYDNWYWMKKAKELRSGLRERVLTTLKNELKGKPKILDLCCGTGHLVKDLSKLGSYTGVDFAPNMIKHCKKTYKNKKFILADAEDLPFKANSFDAVVCFWSFHHILYPDEVFKEIKRILKPDGFVIIATFKSVELNFAAKLGDWISGAYWGYTTQRYSKKHMQRLMDKQFKNIKIETYPKGISLLNAMGIRFLIASGRK